MTHTTLFIFDLQRAAFDGARRSLIDLSNELVMNAVHRFVPL